MNALAFHILRAMILWALHFIAIYALISAACAPRNLVDIDALRLIAGALTLGVAILALVWLVSDIRVANRLPTEAAEKPLATAAFWSAGIALGAILLNLWPIFGLTGCAG